MSSLNTLVIRRNKLTHVVYSVLRVDHRFLETGRKGNEKTKGMKPSWNDFVIAENIHKEKLLLDPKADRVESGERDGGR